MKLVVFSSHDKLHSETKHVVQLFENGLETFHLRKPDFSSKEMFEYINLIPSQYHKYIVLHSHHKLAKKFKLKGLHCSRMHRKKKYNTKFKFFLLKMKHPTLLLTKSCHKIHKIDENSSRYSYVFLSPIYESISKKAHGGLFSERQLSKALTKSEQHVFALGGVDETKFEELKNYGFYGVALLGAIWNTEKSPVDAYTAAQDKIDALNLVSV